LNTKDNLWTEGTHNFTRQEIIDYGYESLFNHFGWTVPNSCFCRRTDNYDYGRDSSSGLCTQCIAMPVSPGFSYNFAACKSTDWCEENCSVSTSTLDILRTSDIDSSAEIFLDSNAFAP
jgi:hypothetical protein